MENVRKFARTAALGVTALLTLALGGIFTLPVVAQGQAGTTLSATVDTTAYYTRTFHWTIDKSVTPDTWNLFTGESGTSTYTIAVTKDQGTDEAWLSGRVCVTNGGDRSTENLTIVVMLYNGYPPPNDLLTLVTVNVSGNPVLDPGETGCYPYRLDIPFSGGAFPQPKPGGTYKVTANVTITNHSGWLPGGRNCPGPAPCPFGPSPSATATLPHSPTLINNTIHVDDTNGSSWMFYASGSVSYARTFTCDSDAGTHVNTATIRETGQSDSASVTVICTPRGGCTLTQGYWKTHSKYGPAPYNPTWAKIGEDTVFFKSGQSWYQVLWTPPSGGNAYYILAHQYIAAKLNILNGAASTPEVDAALGWAEGFFNTYTPSSRLDRHVRAQALSYADLLDRYNNGYIGPGHCPN